MSRVLRAWKYREYPCLVMHNDMGNLCGYVMLPCGHELSGEHYDDINALGIAVHGGLTFARMVNTIDFGDISVVTVAGANENYYMIGFDCAHAGDAPSPMYMSEDDPLRFLPSCLIGGRIWTVDEVAAETESLVDQLCAFDTS